MISRRGFFGMLGALAASPALAPLVKLFPAQAYSTYLLGKEAIATWEPCTMYFKEDGIRVGKPGEKLIWKFEDGSGKTSIFKVLA